MTTNNQPSKREWPLAKEPSAMHYTLRPLQNGGAALGACEHCGAITHDAYYILTEYRRYTRTDGSESSTRANTIQVFGHKDCLSEITHIRTGVCPKWY